MRLETCVDCGVTSGDIAAAEEDLPLCRRNDFGAEMLCEACYGERLAMREEEQQEERDGL